MQTEVIDGKYFRIDLIDDTNNNDNVGYIHCYENSEGQWWIDSIVIRTTFRNKGHAKELLKLAIDKIGNHDILLRVQPFYKRGLNKEQLILLYGSLGFRMFEGSHNIMIKKASINNESSSIVE